MSTGRRQPEKRKKKTRLRLSTGFDFRFPLLPKCHAAFYKSGSYRPDVQVATLFFLPHVSSYPCLSVWTWGVVTTQAQDVTMSQVTATRQAALSLHTYKSRERQQGWQIFHVSCPIQPSSVFQCGAARLGWQQKIWKSKFCEVKQMRACQSAACLNKPPWRMEMLYWTVCIRAQLKQTRFLGSSSLLRKLCSRKFWNLSQAN